MTEVFTERYNPGVIWLSFGIAFLGSYLTITFCYFLRLIQKATFELKVFNKFGVIFAMACALGGIGIWCMHFVGMSSMRLYNPSDQLTPIKFHLFPSLISLIIVILLSGVGLYVASLDEVFGKSKEQIVEIYVKEASQMSIHEIRNTRTSKMLWIISTYSVHHLVLGGFITGSGISVMHYLGMWGMQFNNGKIVWDIGIIVASILIAIIASIVAFWILFRFLSLYPNMELLRIASSFIMAVAVCGMHYTGMSAATFKYELSAKTPKLFESLAYFMKESDAYNAVLVTAVMLGVILFMMSVMELRHWITSLNVELKTCSKLLEQIAGEPFQNMSGLYTPTISKRVANKILLTPKNNKVAATHLDTVIELQCRTQSSDSANNSSHQQLKLDDLEHLNV